MVDQAGQDPIEIEPAPDIAGDPAQRLGAMQQMADLLLAPRDADDGADRIGDDRSEVRVGGAQPVSVVAAIRDHQQNAPRAVRPGDRRPRAR